MILSLQQGSLIEDPMVLAQCFLAILIGFVLIQFGVKNGIHYLSESAIKQEEAEKIAENLSFKTKQNETII